MAEQELEIISSSTCPFAQRTKMVLLEKGINFVLTEIDLDNKPEWFLKISPYGKVPVIRDQDTVIFESAVINEYLEETFPLKPLLPNKPVDRAQARIWIDFANVRFVPQIYKLLLAQKERQQSEHATRLIEALILMEEEGLAARKSGPYWLGENISLVDFTFYPHLQRFCALEYYRNFEIPRECYLLHQWMNTMEKNESIRACQLPREKLINSWSKYAFNTSTGTTAKDMREVV